MTASPWGPALHDAAASLPPDTRRALAAAWLRDAAEEHAAVGAFAQLSLDLLSLGFPAELVDRSHLAARQEVVHARDAYTLASALAGEPLGPGPLPVDPRGALSLEALAASSALDGWRNESLAACMAAARRSVATVPAVCDALDTVVRDEAHHAELAWDIVRHALDVGGDPVREHVLAALRDAPPLRVKPEPTVPAWGRPGHEALQRVLDEAQAAVITPEIDALVA